MRYSIFYLQVTERHWLLSFGAVNLLATMEANEVRYHGETNSNFIIGILFSKALPPWKSKTLNDA